MPSPITQTLLIIAVILVIMGTATAFGAAAVMLGAALINEVVVFIASMPETPEDPIAPAREDI
jgi:hypothetical protein